MDLQIEKALPNDVHVIHQLITELATFEKAPEEMILTANQLLIDGFGDHPLYTCFVARVQNQVQGIALLYTKYSTWKGKCIFLEDIIVTEAFRGKGIGSALFEQAIRYAKQQDAGRLEWQVLDWNESAIQFYKKYNANLDPTWINGKFTREQLLQFQF